MKMFNILTLLKDFSQLTFHIRALPNNGSIPDPIHLNIAKVMQEMVSLCKTRDVMATASEKEWEKAREDFQAIVFQACATFRVFMAMSTLPRWLKFNMLVKTALFSLPVLLSMRQKGYGHWIDTVRMMLKEFDDVIKEQLASGEK